MLKTKMRDMPVITIHISNADKSSLETLAQSKGLQLTPYCRSLLLAALERERQKQNGQTNK